VTMEKNYERIGPMAWGVAYRRTFSDIPYSLEIFEALRRIVSQPPLTPDLENPNASSHDLQFEARFKLVDLLLERAGTKQVLEIASGFSPRGIRLAQNPSVKYVEIDLPAIIELKKDIVHKLTHEAKIPAQANLHFVEGDALKMPDLERAAQWFGEEPIAVVNEGLLRYLTFEQQASLARNIHCLLERHSGVWITPDISVQKKGPGHPDGKAKKHLQVVLMSGIDLSKNRFESEEAACAFFENLGFSVERHGFMEAAEEMALPQKLNFTQEQVAERIGKAVAFVMRIR